MSFLKSLGIVLAGSAIGIGAAIGLKNAVECYKINQMADKVASRIKKEEDEK